MYRLRDYLRGRVVIQYPGKVPSGFNPLALPLILIENLQLRKVVSEWLP